MENWELQNILSSSVFENDNASGNVEVRLDDQKVVMISYRGEILKINSETNQ